VREPDPTLALGRKNWLFTGSLRSGKRAAAIMSLIQSARLNSHDPYAYLKDVLTRLLAKAAAHVYAVCGEGACSLATAGWCSG